TRQLAETTVEMVDQIMNGEEPEDLDTETYDNGEKVVPSVQLPPEVVYKDNYEELLIDSGYYTEDELEQGCEKRKVFHGIAGLNPLVLLFEGVPLVESNRRPAEHPSPPYIKDGYQT